MLRKIGFGGGCHWCTEAVFQSLNGVVKVEQGWISSRFPDGDFSEAVIVHYDENIDLQTLIEVHLLTHSSTKMHGMRGKYRSAVYYFEADMEQEILDSMKMLSDENGAAYITRVLPFGDFRCNVESQLNYYLKKPDAPFCLTYIAPKLKLLKDRFHK